MRAAAGEFADADNWLQQAITWRENTLGQKDPKIADDLLISVSLCRGLKDFDRALVILRRVQGLHVEAYTYNSAAVADDFSRIGKRLWRAEENRQRRQFHQRRHWPSAPNWAVRSTPPSSRTWTIWANTTP